VRHGCDWIKTQRLYLLDAIYNTTQASQTFRYVQAFAKWFTGAAVPPRANRSGAATWPYDRQAAALYKVTSPDSQPGRLWGAVLGRHGRATRARVGTRSALHTHSTTPTHTLLNSENPVLNVNWNCMRETVRSIKRNFPGYYFFLSLLFFSFR